VFSLAATRELRRVGSIARFKAAARARVSLRVRSSAEDSTGFFVVSSLGLGGRIAGVAFKPREARSAALFLLVSHEFGLADGLKEET